AQAPLRTLRSFDERIDASGSEQTFAQAVFGNHSSRPARGLLALAGLALDDLLDLLLHGTACHGGSPFWLGRRLLARGAFQLLAVFGRFNALCIHRVFVIRP